jgi:type IV pilus assembly protein PilW
MSPTCRIERQQGRLLLELSVAMALGLGVVLAALATLAFIQTSATLHGDALQLQRRADLAMHTLGLQLHPAGSIQLVDNADGRVRFSTAFDGYASSGQIVGGSNGRGAQPDTLTSSRGDDGETRDCLGNRPDATALGIRIDSHFSVRNGQLRCLGAHATTGAQVIVDGVEDFQVSYGLRSPGASGLAFQFVDADAVGARWPEVGAVRVCLQLHGDAHHPNAPAVHNCQNVQQPADGRLRQTVTATFMLRNAAP